LAAELHFIGVMQPPMDRNYQCSELVNVLYEDRLGNTRATIANLEEISSKSVTLLCDAPLDPGLPLSFSVKSHALYGFIQSCVPDPILGWFIKIRLDRCSRWSGRWFMPEHFLALCASARTQPRDTTPPQVFNPGIAFGN